MVAAAVLLLRADAFAQPGPSAAPRNIAPMNVVRVDVLIRSSLEQALHHAVPQAGKALAAQVARLLRWRGDVARKLRPGDRLQLIFVHPRADVEPEILALDFRGALLQLTAFRFAAAGDGIYRYYDADGWRVEPTMRNPPVPHYWQITETVQHGRGRRRHRGDDFRAPEGSVVILPFRGTITRTNWSRRRNGRCVEVQLDAGYLAHFLHLQQLAPEAKAGRVLEAGSVLGTVGNTGRSTGAHLHYELLRHRRPVEPLKIHGQRRDQLQGLDLAQFVGVRDALRGQLQRSS